MSTEVQKLATEFEVTPRQVRRMLAAGMPAEVEAARRWRSARRQRIKPAARIRESDPAGEARTVEEIRHALTIAGDYDTVKILSEKLRGLLVAEKLLAEMAELVRVDDAEQSGRRIERVCQLAIAELAAGAPRLAGLAAVEIHGHLMEHGNAVLGMMADEQSTFWKAAAAEFPVTDERLA